MNNNRAARHIALCMAGISLALAMLVIPAAPKEQQSPTPVPEPVPVEAIVGIAEIIENPTSKTDSASSTPTYTHEKAFESLNISLPVNLQEHTWNEAQRIGIDPEILYKLMWRESGYQVDAWCIDSNGYESVGLCQINGMAFSWCEDRGIDPHTPEGNITAAAELIRYYINERGCSLEEALAAYGAGETGMRSGKGMEAARKLLKGDLPES